MSSDKTLDKVKKLRELTGVGFKDCKNAIDETKGDIEKSIELLRKQGIAKASKRMTRVAAEGLICIYEQDNKFSMIEVNCETDFVAKNKEFIKFVKEVSEICFQNKGNMEKTLNSNMKNKKTINENLVDLISKIGEKITIKNTGNMPEIWEAFVSNSLNWRVTGETYSNLSSLTSGQENILTFDFTK